MKDTAAQTGVDAIARTCLYEGYLLWPYRRSALKNAKRWTFGGVFPGGGCAEALGERHTATAQLLLEHGIGPYEVTVRLRFLQVVDRTVWRDGPEGPERTDALTVAGERHVTWQEATEREVLLTLAVPGSGPCASAVDIPEGSAAEPLAEADGRRAGSVIRGWRRLSGTLTAASEPVAPGVDRLTVRVANTSDCPPPRPGDRRAREEAAAYAFASTHLILHSDQARFISLLDPPYQLRRAAAACANDGVWPVLAGEQDGPDGRRAHTVLASPLTLYDFPAVAPESPGDLFDGTEIDQLLVLSVLSMTEEEQAEARACDPRAREILDRCAGLGLDEMAHLHGAIREFRPAAAPVREDG
ncbi:hypothetical protein [Streptomyces sp. PR69]|uniref:hypothetical protein n=1 Tax=Streptomyces sp. PR69 TaxID=2984950 RepID=UPI002265403B|nr:hypothetical protein [Streptomyces sp. PR69]